MNAKMDISKISWMGYFVSGVFILVDIALLLFFQFYGVHEMIWYNIFSILFYMFSNLMLKYGKFWLYSTSVYIEVIIHMGLCVFFVGSSSGFQLPIIGMNLLAFYSEYLSKKYYNRSISGIALGCIGMVVYLGALIYSYIAKAPYELPPDVCFWMQLIWGTIVFGINIFFLKVFVTITTHSENLLAEAQSKANSMVTALSADYTSVYYINLDDDTGICYQEDSKDLSKMREGIEFPYYELFAAYGQDHVAESYRQGFMNFIDPDNIRENLAEKPIIAYRYLAKRDGHEYYEMIRMAGVRHVEDRDDHKVHAIGLGFTDIDEEMRETMSKNEALAEALVLAEEASKAKTAFLSSMSHEIRTPMNAIIGLDTLALNDPTISPQTREYLEKIGSSAKHLLDLINDILDMSRIESGRMVLRREVFSFSTMMEQINTMVSSQCSDKGITYENKVIGHVEDCYIGDDMKLKEVLINILSNAIKFTNAPGKVSLTVERTAAFEDQSTLQFRIKDTGIGMDKDYIPKIFDAFSQEDSSRKNKYGSTGLGMAITKNLVEMMNGTIDVESEKGVGTEFIVSITFRNADRNAEKNEMSVDAKKVHALVADEDEVAAEHAKTIMEEGGVRADICMNKDDILEMMERQKDLHSPYNLVLLDRNLSGTDGLETSAEIRKNYSRDETVIIMTAYSWDDISKEEAERAGTDGLLTKPIFAGNIKEAFERAARHNNMSMFREKKLAELTGRRILLAEDVEINAEIMKELLKMNDMEADHAENGRIVVEMFEKSEPGTYAAILMDVRMPEMDGLEATAAIRALDREDAKQIPIIAMTANAFDEDVQRSLQSGMNAHLTKPVEPDLLVRTLGELIYEAEEQA